MPRTDLWSGSVPRVELDQRSRDARLELERLERLFLPCAAATHSRLKRLLCLYRLGRSRGERQISRTERPLNDWRPSPMPPIRQSGGRRRLYR